MGEGVAVASSSPLFARQRGSIPRPVHVLPVGLGITAFLIDVNTPHGVADGFLYMLSVLSCFWLPRASAALYAAAGLMAPMAIGLLVSPSGAPIWLELANRLLGAATVWLSAFVVWRNALMTAERAQLLSRIRELSATADRAAYNARLELARWLHEGIGQDVAAVGWGLDQIGNHARDEAFVRTLATDLRAIINDAQRAVRSRAAYLRARLESAELIALIERHVASFGRHTGLDITVQGAANLTSVRGDRADLCFRIVQEALTNTAKHARATHVVVEFSDHSEVLVVSITDDGRGIAASDRLKSASLGLLGLEERLIAIGGSLEVGKVGPTGTRVEGWIPLA